MSENVVDLKQNPGNEDEEYDRIKERLDWYAEQIHDELGLDCVQLFAAYTYGPRDDRSCADFDAGSGSIHARVNLSRNYLITQDEHLKQHARRNSSEDM